MLKCIAADEKAVVCCNVAFSGKKNTYFKWDMDQYYSTSPAVSCAPQRELFSASPVTY